MGANIESRAGDQSLLVQMAVTGFAAVGAASYKSAISRRFEKCTFIRQKIESKIESRLK